MRTPFLARLISGDQIQRNSTMEKKPKGRIDQAVQGLFTWENEVTVW